jgi:hypothetical protein
LPGMCYLWIWPLFFIALAWTVVLNADVQRGSNLFLTAGAIPAVLIVVPMAHKIFTAFAFRSGVAVSALLALLLSLCVVQTGPVRAWRLSERPGSLPAPSSVLPVPTAESKTA